MCLGYVSAGMFTAHGVVVQGRGSHRWEGEVERGTNPQILRACVVLVALVEAGGKLVLVIICISVKCISQEFNVQHGTKQARSAKHREIRPACSAPKYILIFQG